MLEQAPVDALIDRIVTRSRIPGRGAREDLRRELRSHFDDAGESPDALRHAMQQFGDETAMVEAWRRLYRRDYAFAYTVKIAASIAASMAAALLIEVLVNLRIEAAAEAWRLAPGFLPATMLATTVVLGLVTAWEMVRPPLSWSRALVALVAYTTVCLFLQLAAGGSVRGFVTAALLVAIGCACSRLEQGPVRLTLTFVLLAATEYAIHAALSVTFGPSRALRAGAVLTGVWACTIFILGRVDRSFTSLFDAAEPR